MKILFIVQHFPCLSETFILNQITGLIDAGHDVRIYALGKPDSLVLHSDIAKYHLMDKVYYPLVKIPSSKKYKLLDFIHYFPFLIKRFGLKSFYIFDSSKFGEYARNGNLFYSTLLFLKLKWKPDIVITHFGCLGLFPACWKKIKALNNPFVTFFHAHEISPYSDKETSKMYKILFDQNDLLLPISNFWKEKLERCGAKPSNVIVHRMGIDIERFKYNVPRKIKNEINIITVGRLTGQKGYEYALKSIEEFKKNNSLKISYKIIGSGNLEDKLKKMVLDLKLEETVEFLGPQPQNIVEEELYNANVFLLPSVCDKYGLMEGIPVAIMESMAIGLPVISTYHSGIPEIIEHGISGFLCREKNFLDISDMLKIICKNHPLVMKITQNARSKIENEFNIKKLNNRLIDLLKRELSEAAN